MTRSALVVLAEGFEEIEAISIIDVLRRSGIEVTVAGLDGTSRSGSHGIRVEADVEFKDVVSKRFDAVVLPGGQPGTSNLMKSPEVKELVIRQHQADGIVAAMCAAPAVLAAAGILDGKNATCYPGMESQMGGARCHQDRVVAHGRLVTSRGPGTSIDFALKLVELLSDAPTAKTVRDKLLAE